MYMYLCIYLYTIFILAYIYGYVHPGQRDYSLFMLSWPRFMSRSVWGIEMEYNDIMWQDYNDIMWQDTIYA